MGVTICCGERYANAICGSTRRHSRVHTDTDKLTNPPLEQTKLGKRQVRSGEGCGDERKQLRSYVWFEAVHRVEVDGGAS